MAQGTLREVVGTFESTDALEGAISALTSAGWDRAQLSLLAPRGAVAAHLSGRDTRALADDARAARDAVVSDTDLRQERALFAGMAGVITAFVASGATILTGGAALAAVVGAAVAGGGAAAAVSAIGVGAGQSRAAFIDEQIARGGALLWVTVNDAAAERRAHEILLRSGAVHIHGHDAAVQP
jgi:hypothetical protein